ncbi:SDR family NAD(P)-dependent oxidoreductase [Oceanobacillus longus]|uniref:SDR family NAD(P)-dependent oxidoreductase n=1 Tax=Oceanobacillus longus TaxID=930120 RepID=A0ABV8H422_9BACI
MKRLENKVAIITGAAGGQGAEEARLFAKEGAYVVATDVQEELLANTVREINEEYEGRIIGLKHDVSTEESWKEVVEETINKFGTIDILVNNAGIAGKLSSNVLDFSLEDWQIVQDINVVGNFLGIKEVVPHMRRNGSGSIINISSIAAIVGNQGGVPYQASKGATRALTKSVALDLAKDGIRVNSVHPGLITTPMSESALDDEGRKQMESTIPLGFSGEPKDIAYPVLFLASDESRFMTGSELVVDGGTIAQ